MNAEMSAQQLLSDENNPQDWEDEEEDEVDSEVERAEAAELAKQNTRRRRGEERLG